MIQLERYGDGPMELLKHVMGIPEIIQVRARKTAPKVVNSIIMSEVGRKPAGKSQESHTRVWFLLSKGNIGKPYDFWGIVARLS
jgi:hypothetical protein